MSLETVESGTVTTMLRRQYIAYWHVRLQQWVVEPGEYEVVAGVSSRDLRASGLVAVQGDVVTVPVTGETTLGELMADPEQAALIAPMFAAVGGGDSSQTLGMDMARMMASIPLERLAGFGGGGMDRAALDQLIQAANA